MEDLSGKQFGGYRIVEPLGEGGMAAVFKAYQASMDRYVAVKVLPRQLARSPEYLGRFNQEAMLLANLQHTHILPVFDYGESDGYTYLVMPLVRSGTLAQTFKGVPMPLKRIRTVISQIGDALDYAHAQGLVHRDIKPSNVLLDERGNCLLTDFGIARMVESTSRFTLSGAIIGTPAYMSPEQGQGDKVDARSDIYALGIILYEMAVGRVPFQAETPVAVIIKHLQEPLPMPRVQNPNLPEAVEKVILKALAKNPDERYPSAAAMVSAIQAAIPEESSSGLSAGIQAPAAIQAPNPLPTLDERSAQAAETQRERKTRLPPLAWAGIGLLLLILCVGGAVTLGLALKGLGVWGTSAAQVPSTRPSRTHAPITPGGDTTPQPTLAETLIPGSDMPGSVSETPKPPAATPTPREMFSTLPPMPSPQVCDAETDPFWHWQMGAVVVNDISFASAEVGYAVGSFHYILRTMDGGVQWRALSIPALEQLNSVYFTSAESGWAAGNKGVILHTTDGAKTWQVQDSGTQSKLNVIRFLNEQTGWAAGDDGKLLYTTDGGASWKGGATGQQMSFDDLYFASAQEGYLAGSSGPSGIVLRSSDGGKTWGETVMQVTVPKSVFATTGGTVWAGGGWVFGSLWRNSPGGSAVEVLGDVKNTSGCGYYPFLRTILFSGEQRGWVGGYCGLAFATEDGGANWQPMNVNADVNWLRLRYTGAQEIILAGYSSTFKAGFQTVRSNDDGKTWQPGPSPNLPTYWIDMLDLDFVDAWSGWALAQENYKEPVALFRTRSGGRDWEKMTAPGGVLKHMQFIDQLRGWIIGDSGMVTRTDDGGQTWEIQPIQYAKNFQSMTFIDRETGWLLAADDDMTTCQQSYGTNLILFRTTNGGEQWDKPLCIKLADEVKFNISARLFFLDRQNGWIVTSGGVILKTRDGGVTWTALEAVTAVDLTGVFFLDEQTGWVIGKSGLLMATTDGGTSWKQQRLGDQELNAVRFTPSGSGWVSSNQTLYVTHDSGTTWEQPWSTDYFAAAHLDVVDDNHIWLSGSGSLLSYSPGCLSP